MSTDSERLRTLRKQLKLTQKQFAEKCGVHQQLIAMIENGTRRITPAFELGFLKHFGYDFKTEQQIPKVQSLADSHSYIVPVPFYSAKAAAGAGVELPSYPEKDVIYFDKRLLQNVLGINQENAAFITAKGDSMLPIINDGDLLLVDSSVQDIINGKVFVVKDGNDLRVKRLKQEWNGDIYLISDNEKYPPEKVNHPINIIGRVVWNGTKEIL